MVRGIENLGLVDVEEEVLKTVKRRGRQPNLCDVGTDTASTSYEPAYARETRHPAQSYLVTLVARPPAHTSVGRCRLA